MKFKGDIIITDPCYLMEDKDYEHPQPKLSDYPLPNGQEGWDWEKYMNDCRTWEEKYDDWVRTNYGENLENIGLSTFISEPTIYGDWSQVVYGGGKEDLERVLSAKEDEVDSVLAGFPEYGTFGADSGTVCVVLLSEAMKYNAKVEEWCKSHPWCAHIIREFDGDIEYLTPDNSNRAHLVGQGNINFFTA